MSNIIGATVRINTGKVEYVVTEQNEDGTYNLKGEKSSRKSVEASKLVVVREADVEHAPVAAIEAVLSASQAPEEASRVSEDAEAFDPREDRRQSAYGLAILAAVMRKNAHNPRAFAHNSNPLKSVQGKRDKVRKRVRRQRFEANNLSAQYNELVRAQGYRVQAA